MSHQWVLHPFRENTAFHSVHSVRMALLTPVPKTAIAREISCFDPIRYCVRAQIPTQTDYFHLHLNQLPIHRQMVFEKWKRSRKPARWDRPIICRVKKKVRMLHFSDLTDSQWIDRICAAKSEKQQLSTIVLAKVRNFIGDGQNDLTTGLVFRLFVEIIHRLMLLMDLVLAAKVRADVSRELSPPILYWAEMQDAGRSGQT